MGPEVAVLRPRDPLAGIVLCGGASTRMGADKASLGDPPWAHRVAAVLASAGCGVVELQGGAADLGTSAWRQFADVAPGAGPVPAVAQAAARHRRSGIVFAACDLPNLTTRDVTHLVEVAGNGAAAYRTDQQPNWSLVAVGPTTAERLAQIIPEVATGRSLNAVFRPEAVVVDPFDPLSVTDIDEPPGNLDSAADTRNLWMELPVEIEEINVDELATHLDSGVVLLDVREALELATARVPGVTHIPLGELEARAAEIPEGDLFVICHSGVRSMVACQQLETLGRRAVNVAGGTSAWMDSGRTTESG